MIKIKSLKVKAGDKKILKGIDLKFETGKNYCILGKNGSGKSSLASVLAGNPQYEVISGKVTIDSKDLISMSPEERSSHGLFLSFQNIPEIKGINLGEYLRVIYNTHLKKINGELRELSPFLFKRFIKKYLQELDIDEIFLSRDLNVGFSGGEKRKIEILQMKLIKPKYIILDEIDSGLDLDAFKVVANMLQSISNKNTTFIIITHYFKILDFLDIDKVYIMKNGEIIKKGEKNLVLSISKEGFG